MMSGRVERRDNGVVCACRSVCACVVACATTHSHRLAASARRAVNRATALCAVVSMNVPLLSALNAVRQAQAAARRSVNPA